MASTYIAKTLKGFGAQQVFKSLEYQQLAIQQEFSEYITCVAKAGMKVSTGGRPS